MGKLLVANGRLFSRQKTAAGLSGAIENNCGPQQTWCQNRPRLPPRPMSKLAPLPPVPLLARGRPAPRLFEPCWAAFRRGRRGGPRPHRPWPQKSPRPVERYRLSIPPSAIFQAPRGTAPPINPRSTAVVQKQFRASFFAPRLARRQRPNSRRGGPLSQFPWRNNGAGKDHAITSAGPGPGTSRLAGSVSISGDRGNCDPVRPTELGYMGPSISAVTGTRWSGGGRTCALLWPAVRDQQFRPLPAMTDRWGASDPNAGNAVPVGAIIRKACANDCPLARSPFSMIPKVLLLGRRPFFRTVRLARSARERGFALLAANWR